MYDEISSESKQNFIVLSFQERQDVDSLITVLDSNDNPLMSYKSDRVYTNLVYSSSNLSNGTYYLYHKFPFLHNIKIYKICQKY